MRSRAQTGRPAAARRRPVRAVVRRRRARPGDVRRRRLVVAGGVAVATALVLFVIGPSLRHLFNELTLPLRHEDIIRQQAHDKGLDPALIASVIYAESRFRDGRTSKAGAVGLMQLTPDTARYIARKSGGIAFRVEDLATPQVNIAYGSYYLRYLLDRYGDNQALALAAYNAGEGNVDRWIGRARQLRRPLTVDAIPFGETREYVKKVLRLTLSYRHRYARELGLRRSLR